MTVPDHPYSGSRHRDPRWARWIPFLFAVAAAWLTACATGEGTESITGLRLQMVAGGGQTVATGALSDSLRVRVLDADDRPVPGVEVAWAVTRGPGTVVPATDTTDAAGYATTIYLATADTGTRLVTARVGGTDSVAFSLRVDQTCVVGTLGVGQVIDSALTGGSCDRGEFNVTLVGGEAYFFTMRPGPDTAQTGGEAIDPILSLWRSLDGGPLGPYNGEFLVGSDDAGGDHTAEFFFVAPASGTYRLLAIRAHDDTSRSPGRGSYRLSFESCPLVAPPTAGLFTLPDVPAGACVRHYAPGLTAQYRFLKFPIGAGQRVAVTLTSADFTPVWDAFVDWDPYHRYTSSVIGSGATRDVVALEDGVLTIAIGDSSVTAGRHFSVAVADVVLPPPGSQIEKAGGDDQDIGASDTSFPIVVQVRNAAGGILPNVPVFWEVTAGPGHMTTSVSTSRAFDGEAYTYYQATTDTGAVAITARIGTIDSVQFTLHVGAPCAIGAFAVGQTVDSTFPAGRCSHGEFSIPLDSGNAYFFTLTHQPDPARAGVDSVDPELGLWHSSVPGPLRPGTAQRLALSDNEGGDHNSEFFFVAPSSGTYRLVVGHRSPFGPGAYRLTAQECPVMTPSPDPGSRTYTLPASPCLRHYGPGLTSQYRFLSMPSDPFADHVSIAVHSDDLTPVWQTFIDWDPANSPDPGPIIGNDSTVTYLTDLGALTTIAIGGTTPTAAGKITVTVTRSPAGSPPRTRKSIP